MSLAKEASGGCSCSEWFKKIVLLLVSGIAKPDNTSGGVGGGDNIISYLLHIKLCLMKQCV